MEGEDAASTSACKTANLGCGLTSKNSAKKRWQGADVFSAVS